MTIRPEDDLRRAPFGSDPFLNESWYFNALDPENDLAVFLRIGLFHNRGRANMGVLIRHQGREIYSRLHNEQPMPGGNVDPGLTIGGLTIRAEALFSDYKLSFDDEPSGLSFDIDWRALHPPVDGAAHVPAAAPGSAHYEQGGRISGTIAYRGERLTLQGVGNRDHSVGRRDWSRFDGHRIAWIVFEDELCVSAGLFDYRRRGRVDMNWMWREGREEHLAIPAFEVEENDDGRMVSGRLVAKPDTGDPIEIAIRSRGASHWPFDGYYLEEGFGEFTRADGVKGWGLLERGIAGRLALQSPAG